MRELTRQLRPGAPIQGFIDTNTKWLTDRSYQLQVAAKYITTQALLHLPYYDTREIIHDSSGVLSDIDPKIASLSRDYKEAYDRLYESTEMSTVSSSAVLRGKNVLSIHDGENIIPVGFSVVPDLLAEEINDHLHYIRSSRGDSIASYGLFIDGAETPYASVSFSQCVRDYQLRALNEVAGVSLRPDQVLSYDESVRLQ